MHKELTCALCTLLLLTGALSFCAGAEDVVVSDPASGPVTVEAGHSNTGDETEALLETETVYEIPLGITDGLKKDTPIGEAAAMTQGECDALMDEIFQANSAQRLWGRHENISAAFRYYDADAQMWKEYSTFFADPLIYYSDDWSPGLEELRLLIYGENGCVEDYTSSMRFICFLNASEIPYRNSKTDPVTLTEDTKDEMLLSIHRSDQALFIITQLTESSILRFDLDEPEEDSFYSCLYLLDPDTLEVQLIQITLHGADDADQAGEGVRNISFSYDHGMSPFVETGYMGLIRHLEPGVVWAPEDLRDVTVTLDPGTDTERKKMITSLKGDPVSITLPDGYELYSDETLTTRWIDNGDYASNLALWAAGPQEAAP